MNMTSAVRHVVFVVQASSLTIARPPRLLCSYLSGDPGCLTPRTPYVTSLSLYLARTCTVFAINAWPALYWLLRLKIHWNGALRVGPDTLVVIAYKLAEIYQSVTRGCI